MIKIKKGLNLPIEGEPVQAIDLAMKIPKRVALVGRDYVGLRPTFVVKEGQKVQRGELLFTDKKNPGVKFVSPVAGEVEGIFRGEKRAFQSIVIKNEEGPEDLARFEIKRDLEQLKSLSEEEIRNSLVESGLWTSLRTRPFSRIPDIHSVPHSIFINAMDTNPLAPDMRLVIAESYNLVRAGAWILTKLTAGKVFVCKAPDTNIPLEGLDAVHTEVFAGPHPAGLPGTHIHFLDPVGEHKTVWHIGIQDVIAIGMYFLGDVISPLRTISVAGPMAQKPRLLKTILGASVDELLQDGELKAKAVCRPISGSVFSGYTAQGDLAFLGRYHQQLSLIVEDYHKEFIGWMLPGLNKFSLKNTFVSKLCPRKKFAFSSNMNGSERSIIPVGSYEKVMPLDIQPTMLLRSLYGEDIDLLIQLGSLELDEEDLALCTFACPSKLNHGQALREKLDLIYKEG